MCWLLSDWYLLNDMTTTQQKSYCITNKTTIRNIKNNNTILNKRLIIIIRNLLSSSLSSISLPCLHKLFVTLLLLLFLQQQQQQQKQHQESCKIFMASALLRTVVSSSSTASTRTGITRSIMEPIIIVPPQEINLYCSDGIHIAGQSYITPNLLVSNQQQQQQQQQSAAAPIINGATTTTTNNIQQQLVVSHQPHHRILCLHGWMDNCRSFHSLAPALIQHFTQQSLSTSSSNSNSNNNTDSSTAITADSSLSCQVVAIDLPGHGLSSHKGIDSPPALLAESIFYVNEALHQLQWDHETKPFTLIGHSMGAAISCLYAAAFPEQINKLILLEGLGPFARNGKDVGKHVRQHVLRRRLGLEQNKLPRIYPSLEKAVETRQLTATNFPGKQYLSKEGAYEMVLRGTKPVEGGNGGSVQFIHDPRLQWPSIQYFTKEQVEGLYHDIQCPTALLIAEDGWPFDNEIFQRTLEILKPTVVHKLPGSHHFHTDPNTSERVAHEVIQFLSSS